MCFFKTRKLFISVSLLIFFITIMSIINVEAEKDIISTKLQDNMNSIGKTVKIQDTNYDGIYAYNMDENGVWAELYSDDVPDGICGIIGYDGNICPATNYLFYDGIARVKVNDKYGYINEKYEWIVPPIYDNALDFENGYGFLINYNKTENYLSNYNVKSENYIIDKEGKVVFSNIGRFYLLDKNNDISDDDVKGSFLYNNYMYFSQEQGKYVMGLDFIPHEIMYTEAGSEFVDVSYKKDSGIFINSTIAEDKATKYSAPASKRYELKSYVYGRDGKLKYVFESNVPAYAPKDDIVILANGNIACCTWNNCLQSNDGLLTVISPEGEVLSKTNLTGYEGSYLSVHFDLFEDRPSSAGWGYNEFLILRDKAYNIDIGELGTIQPIDKELKYNSRIGFRVGDYEKAAFIFCKQSGYEEDYYINAKNNPRELYIIYKEGVILNDSPKFVDVNKIPEYKDKNAETDNKIKIYIDHEKISFENEPVMESDRVLVPMRKIFETLGAEVIWDDESQTAMGKTEEVNILITIDSNIIIKNNEPVEIDVPARLFGDRTFVPLRAVSESFGYDVGWNEEEQRVDILKR